MEKFRLTDQDRATLQFKVTTKLRDLILTGEFKMGERLMQEEWAKKLGVSRMPLREALRQLETEGLVRIEPRRGAIVTPVSTEDIEEIYELRAILEGEAVVRSLPNLTDEKIEELESLYEEMAVLQGDARDMEAFMKLNMQFHQVLRDGCSWKRIKGFIDTLWKGVPPYTPSLLVNHLEHSHNEHRLMVEYAKQRDTEKLHEVTIRHIRRTKESLIEMVQKK